MNEQRLRNWLEARLTAELAAADAAVAAVEGIYAAATPLQQLDLIASRDLVSAVQRMAGHTARADVLTELREHLRAGDL